jgi:hypothetical protein
MTSGLLLAIMLAAAAPERDAARAELEAVAVRIEQLKARHAAGEAGLIPELQPLLVRAQELALTLDRIDHPGAPAGHPPLRNAAPTAEELHERADAARDEVDRIRSALEEVEAHLAEQQAPERAPQARFASDRRGPVPESPDSGYRLAMLELQRAHLQRSLALMIAQAERLEAEARLLDALK